MSEYDIDYVIMLNNAEADQRDKRGKYLRKYDKILKKEIKMPSKEEQRISSPPEPNMETAIYEELNKARNRISEIIAENKCESPEELLQKSLHEESLYEAIGREHGKLIQETKSHAEDSKRHLTMIKRLMHGLKKLLYEANNLMLERECGLARELLAECKRKYGESERGK